MSEDVTTSSEDELECRPQNIIAVIDELEEIDSLLDSVPLKTTSNGNQQPPLDAPRHGNHDISERRPLVKTTTYTSLAKLKDNQKRRQDSITDEKIVIKKNVKSFYKKQDALIKMLSDAIDQIESGLDADTSNKWIARAAALSFFMNLLLLVAKVIAAYLSGSISIISSLVDSAIDLVSGVIIFASGRSIKKTNIYKYPIGKTRLEPLAILVLSSIMAVCAVQIIVEAINRIASKSDVNMDLPSIIVMGSTVIVKFFLFLFCRRIHSPSTDALALDHRNDVVSNSVALACGAIATYYWLYADPIGAILMSVYIGYNWYMSGAVQIKQLAGRTAPPEFLQIITWICIHHDERITKIDTVRAFHIGNNYLVEVDIVLPENMTLKEAHNIGEPLQRKLERLKDIERAFVHIDYEFTHKAGDEHKTV